MTFSKLLLYILPTYLLLQGIHERFYSMRDAFFARRQGIYRIFPSVVDLQWQVS